MNNNAKVKARNDVNDVRLGENKSNSPSRILIPEGFGQFNSNDGVIVIIVLGKTVAIVYTADRGELRKEAVIKEEIPIYSDREGFFLRRGRGEIMGSGSVYEHKDDEVIRRVCKKSAAVIAQIFKKTQIRRLYVCIPSYVRARFFKYCPSYVKEKLHFHIDGNYTKERPLEILRILVEAQNKVSGYAM